MSHWDAYNLDQKITAILANPGDDPGHHFGRPFFTAHQLAIEFADRFREAVPDGYEIGGKGSGVRRSLDRYLARFLSGRIKAGRIANIEGRFLSNQRPGSVFRLKD